MYNQNNVITPEQSFDRQHKSITGAYLWMFFSLLVSAVSSFVFSVTPFATQSNPIIWLIILAVEWIAMYFIYKEALKNPTLGKTLLILFSAFDGATMSGVFAFYSAKLIGLAFLMSAVPFGAMSLIGYKSKKDYSSWYRPLLGCVIGMVIVLFIEMLFHNPTVYMFVSMAGILVFSIMAMVDTNHIKMLANKSNYPTTSISIVGALSLYIDFMNLVIDILNVIGSRN